MSELRGRQSLEGGRRKTLDLIVELNPWIEELNDRRDVSLLSEYIIRANQGCV